MFYGLSLTRSSPLQYRGEKKGKKPVVGMFFAALRGHVILPLRELHGE